MCSRSHLRHFLETASPTRCEPSGMNLLQGQAGAGRSTQECCWVPLPAAPSPNPPEVPHVVEHGLLVEDVLAAVNDDRAVHVVLDPVGAPLKVQGQVPVGPAGHKVVQDLGSKERGSGRPRWAHSHAGRGRTVRMLWL